MEVFLRKIPPQTSERELRTRIKAKIEQLGLAEWFLHVFKNKTCATITFLYRIDGTKFINASLQHPGVVVASTRIMASASKNIADKLLLQSLQHEHDNKADNIAVDTKKQQSCQIEGIVVNRVDCGYLDYDTNGDLTFNTEWYQMMAGRLIMANRHVLFLQDPTRKVTQSYLLQEQTTTSTQLRMYMRFHEISQIVYQQDDQIIVHIVLNIPPRFYSSTETITMKILAVEKKTFMTRLSGFNHAHSTVTGVCLCYRFQVTSDPASLRKFLRGYEAPSNIPARINFMVSPGFRAAEKSLVRRLLELFPDQFGIRFQLHRLVLNGYLLPQKISVSFLSLVRDFVNEHGPNLIVDAIYYFGNKVPAAGPESTAHELTSENLVSIFRNAINTVKVRSQLRLQLRQRHQHLTLVHRVTITPTGIVLNGPWLESKNRVLRRFENDVLNNFIRMELMDENGDHIKWDPIGHIEGLLDTRFLQALKKGVDIGGVHFDFLGFSTSSLREQSCWMMSSFKHNGVNMFRSNIVEQLGNFSDIRSPAKCAARIGQAFTDTARGTAVIDPANVKQIEDIERNERVFSDGCGTISPELLEKFGRNFPRAKPRPVLFQIRFKGQYTRLIATCRELISRRCQGNALR